MNTALTSFSSSIKATANLTQKIGLFIMYAVALPVYMSGAQLWSAKRFQEIANNSNQKKKKISPDNIAITTSSLRGSKPMSSWEAKTLVATSLASSLLLIPTLSTVSYILQQKTH